MRLCQPIEGLDAAQLASWLGLDPSAYAHRQQGGEERTSDHMLPTAGPMLFEGEPLVLRCPSKDCSALTSLGQGENVRWLLLLDPIVSTSSSIVPSPYSAASHNAASATPTSPLYKSATMFQWQLGAMCLDTTWSGSTVGENVTVGMCGSLSHQGWLVCEDRTCSYRTRSAALHCPACNSGSKLGEEVVVHTSFTASIQPTYVHCPPAVLHRCPIFPAAVFQEHVCRR